MFLQEDMLLGTTVASLDTAQTPVKIGRFGLRPAEAGKQSVTLVASRSRLLDASPCVPAWLSGSQLSTVLIHESLRESRLGCLSLHPQATSLGLCSGDLSANASGCGQGGTAMQHTVQIRPRASYMASVCLLCR
jgi:hypothetical protein